MPPMTKPMIGVIGGGVCDTKIYTLAMEIGSALASLGAIVVCGGLGGVMEGVSRGASEAGGEVIAILPSTGKTNANKFATIVIPTGLGEARNVVLVNTADAIIALPGEFGTLSEIAFALRAGKPIFSLGQWSISSDIIEVADPVEAARMAVAAAGEKNE